MTGDEMQRAIEFLLKSQENFEMRFEEWDRRIESRFIESDRRFELHVEETNQRFAHTNQLLETLAETQTEFTQTVLGFVTSQNEINIRTQKKFDEIVVAQQRMQQEISDLTKAINNFMKSSSGNGNSPQDS